MRPRTGVSKGVCRSVGVFATLCLTALPVRAQETCGPEAPPPVALCSVGGMLDAVNPSQTGDVFGNLNPAAFAGGANADLMPGQASISISGGVNAGGTACARHLAAKRIGGTDGVPGMDQGTVDFLEEMSGETLDIPTASGGTRRAVFDIFSPNIISYQGSSLGKPLAYRHDGVGGWPRNSGAHVIIALKNAGPGDLRAGESYEAHAVGGGGDGDPMTIFTSWTGQIQPRPFLPPRTENQRREQEFQKRMCHAVRESALEVMEFSTIPMDATVGREIRDMDCDMDGVGQAGTRTRVPGGDLSGTVHIERITDTKVIGRFELSGTARVERENRTWSSRGPGRVDIDRDAGEKPLRVTGRFAAPNMRTAGYAISLLEIAQAPSDGTAPSAELRLVSHRPRRNEENVPWEAPGIRLTFDRPLDPISVTPAAVKLETALAAGEGGGFIDETKLHRRPYPASVMPAAMQVETGLINGRAAATMERKDFDRLLQPASVKPTEVQLATGPPAGQGGVVMEQPPIQIRLSGPDTIVVTPLGPLRDGVRYRVTLRAGANGILGAEGEPLVVDRAWGFDTMVDLDDNEIVSEGIARHLEWREGVESDTIQVSTNAPLVRDKPAAIRVYAKWRADPQIAPGWHVLGFDAHVRVRPLFPPQAPLIAPERRGIEIRRPDLYSDEERRKAENSVNLYGWTPDFKEAVALRTEIEPVRDCDTAPRVFSGVEELDWDPLDRDLDIGYVFAEVGPWVDGIPPGRRQEGAQAAQAAETFIEQLFPVGEARITTGPAVPFPSDLAETLAWDIREIAIAESAAGTLDESLPDGWLDWLDSYDGDSMTLLREAKALLKNTSFVEPLYKRGDIRLTILRHMHDSLVSAGAYGDFDAVIVFMPFEWLQLLGVTKWDIGPRFMWPDVDAPIMFTKPIVGMSLTGPDSGKPGIPSVAAITHEVGHVFGLEHNPDVESKKERRRVCDALKGTRMDGIEGLRMAPGGASAALKSSEDGNAQRKVELLALMFPCTADKDSIFITQSNYEKLLETLRPGAFEVPLGPGP